MRSLGVRIAIVIFALLAGLPLRASNAFEPLWFSKGHLTLQGAQLLEQLRNVESRGLIPADYDVARLEGAARATAAEAPLFDAALSSAAARLVTDLHEGRMKPSQMGYDLDVPRPVFDATAAIKVLATARDVGAALDGFEPQLRHYALLKTSLARYRVLAQSPELTQLPPLPRTRVRPGEGYAGAPALRRLLRALGDMGDERGTASAADPAVLDPALVAGLARFQTRHGLDADGVLGRSTYRALITPLGLRVQQISLSLERVRWLPPRLDTPPIIVNIPQFRLFAFRTTQDFAHDILQMNVIVGSAFEGRRTPVFAADMRYVVLQPYWDVPFSILRKELLPDIRKNPAWVADNGYEIVRGPGDDARPVPATAENIQLLAEGKLRLRQKPGKANALGHVKFMFPNRHNVYLHDTPTRALFSRSRRAFSHGCIRVAEPMALLAHVMRDDPTWTPERLAAALESETPVRVPLRQPIRVFILYGTALATEAGDTLFFEDLYGQDAPLIARLAARHTT